MEPFGDGWEGRVVEGRFPLLKRVGGTENCGLYFTVLQGMQEAVIQLIATDDLQANTDVAQWTFAMSLVHPNLAKVFSAGRCVLDGRSLVYVVGEHSSTNLAQMIESGSLETLQAKEIFDPIVDALIYLHSNGVVHGHLSPSNIHFSGSNPRLLLTDLLVAGSVKRNIPAPGNYDAPELRRGEVTAAADTWSLGVTIWEAMTRTPPSWDLWGDGEPKVPESLPAPFREIAQDCLRLDPSRRCQLETVQAKLGLRESAPLAEEVTAKSVEAHVNPDPVVLESAQPVAESAQPIAERPQPVQAPIAVREVPVAARPAPPERLPVKIESETPEETAVFSGTLAHFEEAHLPQSRVMPFVFVLLAVIAIGAVLVVREHKSWFSPAAVAENGSAVSVPAPQKQAPSAGPSDSAQSAPAQPEGPQANPTPAPAGSQSQPAEQPKNSAQSEPAADQPSQLSGVSQPPSNDHSARANGNANETGHAQSESAHAAKGAAPEPAAAPDEARTEENAGGVVAKRVMPAISPGARESMRRPVQVLLRVTVNREGAVSDASYVVPGPGNYFARVSQRAALSWKFKPPVRNGDPERSVWMLKFNFGREGTEATATRQEE